MGKGGVGRRRHSGRNCGGVVRGPSGAPGAAIGGHLGPQSAERAQAQLMSNWAIHGKSSSRGGGSGGTLYELGPWPGMFRMNHDDCPIESTCLRYGL